MGKDEKEVGESRWKEVSGSGMGGWRGWEKAGETGRMEVRGGENWRRTEEVGGDEEVGAVSGAKGGEDRRKMEVQGEEGEGEMRR